VLGKQPRSVSIDQLKDSEIKNKQNLIYLGCVGYNLYHKGMIHPKMKAYSKHI